MSMINVPPWYTVSDYVINTGPSMMPFQCVMFEPMLLARTPELDALSLVSSSYSFWSLLLSISFELLRILWEF
jgi:hypothetical protein